LCQQSGIRDRRAVAVPFVKGHDARSPFSSVRGGVGGSPRPILNETVSFIN
jgi:hypothetical protein